ncbi:MAG: undecaprenyl-diphosphate phosphatase [Acidobacteriota bacterium]
MSAAAAFLLAILQGLTEFLPVSSSGHLVLAQNLLERSGNPVLAQPLAFDLLLHLGTLASVLVYFRRDLLCLARSLAPADGLTPAGRASHNTRRALGLAAVALLPTGLVGLPLRTLVGSLMHRPLMVCLLLAVTGGVLLSTRRVGNSGPAQPATLPAMTWTQALGLGAAQGLAVLPGLSRSGLTIAAGLALGMSPMAAFRWSFLISIPAIAGAAVLEIPRQPGGGWDLRWTDLGAALAAGLVGLLALRLVAGSLVTSRFHHFAWYCLTLAAGGALFWQVMG